MRHIYRRRESPSPSIPFKADRNSGLAIADTFKQHNNDSSLLPEKYAYPYNADFVIDLVFSLCPKKGIICDVGWFPTDNSIAGTLSNAGIFNLIDMNTMNIADTINVNAPSTSFRFTTNHSIPSSVLSTTIYNLLALFMMMFYIVGTKEGIRRCDLKTGTVVQLFKSKFGCECIEMSPVDSNIVYSGLSTGKILVWDIRNSSKTVKQLSLIKKESPVCQIVHKSDGYGSIFAGYGNGKIVSFLSDETILWERQSNLKSNSNNMFSVSDFGIITVLGSRKLEFLDCVTGEVESTFNNELLTTPTSILTNDFTNVQKFCKEIFVFDPNYIGTIFRLKPKHLYYE